VIVGALPAGVLGGRSAAYVAVAVGWTVVPCLTVVHRLLLPVGGRTDYVTAYADPERWCRLSMRNMLQSLSRGLRITVHAITPLRNQTRRW
jgi:hypothetical protein